MRLSIEGGTLLLLPFAYRSSSSTMVVTALFKEAISNYITQGSSVLAEFMYMSKKFEILIHNPLLQKIVKLNISSTTVRALSFILTNSTVHVMYVDA